MASKLSHLLRHPLVLLALLAILAVLGARMGHPVGLWDGPI